MHNAQGFISLLEITAVITTILQYLSGALICLKYVKKKINKKSHVKQFLFIVLALFGIILYDNSLMDTQQSQKFMGIVCCIVTVCFFAAPLINLLHVIRIKNSESLPFPMIIMSFLVSIQWLVYGIIISDTFIQLPNFLGCILSMLQLCLFVCYPPKSFNGQGYKLVEQSVVF
uniref:Sugar transporter SWEET1 n=1 Tax=Glossina palpalis gambiensis TaxID=67801 RepID=A0A1B0BR72_9MUSC